MFLRYAYSPAFGVGWAVGVQLVSEFAVGTDDHNVTEGFAYTKKLDRDAYVKSSELDLVIPTTITPAVIVSDDIADFSRLADQISLTPSVFPWVSTDGALSSLAVSAGDTMLTAEWNTEHPDSWNGLQEMYSLLERFFEKYH